MVNRQLYTMKFQSSRLKKYDYDIKIDYYQALENGELIAQSDNQILRTIREVVVNNTKDEYTAKRRILDRNLLEDCYMKIEKIRKEENNKENRKEIESIKEQIVDMCFIPEYITIRMDSKKHYEYLYQNGLILNGVKFKRFNSSASQSRVNTVLFIAETVFDELRRITDNGRNLNKPIAPSKLNAYRGLYGSSRFKVSTPRFCVVSDYESVTKMKVNFVTETDDWNEDDEVEIREISKSFNRFDGQGLISPAQAEKWADELELDYVPSQFCIRGSFLKGMLCVFDIHKWVEVYNSGNYIIETIYKDENGNPVRVDLRNIDVIITESQLKLWDSWDSVEHYQQCCDENKLCWGVTLFTPSNDKTFFYQNYQFLQTLNLSDADVIKITNKFVNWVKGVTSENVYYTMLFLMGFEANEKRFMNYIESGEQSWIKALILEPELINDKYIRTKIYNLIKGKIQNASLGQIITDGNFQVIVSDPFAMMEGICGRKVKGLLGKNEFYSNYWNERNVKKVVGSRSPLTYRSEHVIMDLKKNDDTEEWYKYCKSGVILNVHGDETARFAGSDFDYDILATTSDETVIKGVYKNELPVVYQEPKPEKKIPTEDDLYHADTFSFDSIIGGLTNKSTSAYALLSELHPDSIEYDITLKRIKTITKAQSAQIDKTKIGREVKGIVGKWINYKPIPRDKDGNVIDESEKEREARELNNRILLNKHPYFFTHLYKNTKKKYKNHVKQYEILTLQRLGVTLDELKSMKRRTVEQQQFLDEFYRTSPVIESDCVMNKICWRIESIDFEIKNLLKNDNNKDLHNLFVSDDVPFDEDVYKKIVTRYKEYNAEVRNLMVNGERDDKNKLNESTLQEINLSRKQLKLELLKICSNEEELVNYIVHLFYVDNPKMNKDIMWSLFGNVIVNNLMKNKTSIIIPVESNEGDIEYLNKHYKLKEVFLNDNE